MSIFRFICWLRGFHRTSYAITEAIPNTDAAKLPDVRGVGGICRVCREMLPTEATVIICAEWKY